MKKTEVLKHSATIQISNHINLLQRRAWNVLFAEAFDELSEKDIYQIKMKDLVYGLQINSKNETHIKELLEALTETTVKYNVLGKDGKNVWGSCSLLADVHFENGTIQYSYGGILKKNLNTLDMYARISLSMQNRFTSKHALAIYELCVDYFDIKRQSGETSWISVSKYRELMGLAKDEYPQFKILNVRVIKEPLKEINDKSDLWVDIEYKREKRKVTAIKFHIKPNPNKDNFVKKVEALHPALPVPEDIEHPKLYRRLMGYFCFSDSDAREALKTHSVDYITGNLDEVERRIKAGKKIGDIRAYTAKALKIDYRQQKSLFDVEREESRKIAAAKRKAEERQRLEAERQQQERNERLEKQFNSLSEAEQKRIMAKAFSKLESENGFLFGQYQKGLKVGKTLEEMKLVNIALIEIRNKILSESEVTA